MKKIVIFVLIMLLLCGCSQTKETPSANTNNELTSTAAVTKTEDPIVTETPVKDTEITKEPEVTEEPVSEFDSYARKGIYYIGDLTADEIYNRIIELSKNTPAEGTAVADISKLYDIAKDSTEVSGSYKIEVSNSSVYAYYIIDASVGNFIYELRYGGYKAQMDGTIKYNTDYKGYDFSTKFVLDNYDKALEVYNKLFENCKSDQRITKVDDYREGTTWYASFNDEERGYSGLQMSSGTINDKTIYEIQYHDCSIDLP